MSQDDDFEEIKNLNFYKQNNNIEKEGEDDILNDINNLFMSDNGIEEPEKKPVGPITIFEMKKEQEKAAIIPENKRGTRNNLKDVKEISKPIIDSKPDTKTPIIDIKTPKPDTKTTKPDTKTDKKITPKSSTTKCKNTSECDSTSFCNQKSGQCTAKFVLNQSGCTANDQCTSDSTEGFALCYKKKCVKACKVGGSGWCSESASEKCTEVSDSKMFKGLTFNGICEKADKINSKSSGTTSTSKSTIALFSSGSILLLIGSIIGIVYFRGYIKRRSRNNNPDMFLFDKLQRSTSQHLQNPGQNSVALPQEQMNSRLMDVTGARFTRWSALSED